MSTGLIIIGCVILIGVVIVQIGRVTELAGKIRGEEEVQLEANKNNALLGVVFMVGFLVFCVWSAYYYKNWMLGYGPHESASAHGGILDELFDVTVVITGIVFILTQVALFWFAYKYKGEKGRKATFIPHNDMVEVIWTVIPAVVMCFLVVRGLMAWNEVTADIPENGVPSLIPQTENEYLEIEATGSQFLWYLRYPGEDGILGGRDYTKTTALNPLGQVWEDPKNLDDFHPEKIVLPVNTTVRVRITARDVLHNFDLPHFRVKMDAVPGIPTYFVFTPVITTQEYREELKKYPEYQALKDPSDPESEPLWKTFEYELACAELCGSGHFSMRKVVEIVSQEEYAAWISEQKSYYQTSIKGSNEDPLSSEEEGLSTTEEEVQQTESTEES